VYDNEGEFKWIYWTPFANSILPYYSVNTCVYMTLSDLFFETSFPLCFYHCLLLCLGLTLFLNGKLRAGGALCYWRDGHQVLPPQLIIPLHGVAQLGFKRWSRAMSWRHIDWAVDWCFFTRRVA